MRRLSQSASTRQAGVGLIEVLIGLTAGLILLAGIIKVLSDTRRSYRIQDANARLQENGRFALEILARDIRQAGFTGCLRSSRVNFRNILDGEATACPNPDPDFAFRFDIPVEGNEATATAWSPALPTGIMAIAGTDVITLRGPAGSGIRVTATPGLPSFPPGSPAATIFVMPNSELKESDIVVVSDCVNATVFQITDVQSNGSLVVHNTGSSTNPSNCQNNLGAEYGPDAEIFTISTITYFIGTSVGQLALFRREGTANPVALIEGVENMQILYGEDTDNDGNANRYVPADGVNFANVVSVRVALLMRSIDDFIVDAPQIFNFNGAPANPTNDRRLRRVFNSTVGIRNRLPVNSN